jgi:hypothetical protein
MEFFGYISWPFGILIAILVYCNFGIFYGHLVFQLKFWYILWPFGILIEILVYFMAIWFFMYWLYGICIFPSMACCAKKNLSTLLATETCKHKTPTQKLYCIEKQII